METASIASMDEFGAVGYLRPQLLPTGQRTTIARQYSANDSGIVDVNGGSRYSSHVGLSVPNDCYRAWNSDDSESESRRPTVTICRDPHGANGQCHGRLQRLYSLQPKAQGLTTDASPVKFNFKGTKQPDYEELPNSNRSQEELEAYTAIDECSVLTEIAPCCRNEEVCVADGKQPHGHDMGANTSFRRRHNPPSVNQAFYPGEYPPKNQKPCRSTCCCVLQTVGFLLAIVAMVLAVISIAPGMTGRHEKNYVDGDKNKLIYDNLSRMYEDLAAKYSALNEAVQNASSHREDAKRLSEETLVQMLLYNNSEVLRMINQLRTQDMNISESINKLNSDLNDKMSEVHFMRRGLTNLSHCHHRLKSNGDNPNFPTSTTSLDLTNYTVLSVTCSTNGGTQAFLQEPTSDKPNEYKCECRGKTEGSSSRYCTMHVWVCPIAF